MHPRTVANLVQATVKSALENHLSSQIKQPVNFQPSVAKAMAGRPLTFSQPNTYKPFVFDTPHPSTPLATSDRPVFANPTTPEATTRKQNETHQTIAKQTNINSTTTEQNAQQKNYELIGQYKKTYLLLEKDDGLFLVDQHAAHERILYELFSKRFQDVATIKLMFPQIIDLNADDMHTVTPHLNIFLKNGIEIEPFGDTQLTVQSTPVHIKNIKIDELVRQVASWIREHDNLDEKDFFKAINEKLHAQMSCKAAVKAGDILTREQMEQLLVDLQKAENRLTCPHGRPTGWLLSIYEIEKKFKRVL